MTEYIKSTAGHRLAYRKSEGASGHPRLVWFSGFNSDMTGSKVVTLEAWAKDRAIPFLAFDYSGHGESEGEFAKGTISGWRDDCLTIVDALTEEREPLVLVGSSMGGWMALLTALARKSRIAGMVLIAPAPDFTQKLMWAEFDEAVKTEIMQQGFWMRPSEFGDPYPITRDLIEDGRNWQIMDEEIALTCPVRILQGVLDDAVPWQHSQALVSKLASEDVVYTLVKDGDHRLSRDHDIARLLATVGALMTEIQNPE